MEEGKKKQVILISGVVICLCVLVLTAVTVGLFGSRCAGATVGLAVSTGKLELDIVDAEERSLLNQILQFRRADPSAQVLFEPGTRILTQGFKVMNRGNIPIRFCIGIDAEEAAASDFLEAFEVWIVTADGERMEREMTGLLDANAASEMYFLVIKMKESAGNTFQGKTYTGIGITVRAVQQKPGTQE